MKIYPFPSSVTPMKTSKTELLRTAYKSKSPSNGCQCIVYMKNIATFLYYVCRQKKLKIATSGNTSAMVLFVLLTLVCYS